MGTETTEVARRIDSVWSQALTMTEQFVTKQELTELPKHEIEALEERFATTLPMQICSLKRLVYNPEEGIVDKLVNVYSSLHSMDASVFLIVRGLEDGQTQIYIGTRARKNAAATSTMLKRSFEGNFPGITLDMLESEQKEQLLDECFPLEYERKHVVSLSVSSDFRKEKKEMNATAYIQGIEKFIETMKGQCYSALFLAEPISKEDCIEKRNSYENMITELSKCNKMNVTYSEGGSTAVSESLADGVTDTITTSISHSVSTNTSKSIGKTKGKSSGSGMGILLFNFNRGKNKASIHSETEGKSDTESDSTSDAKGTTQTRTKGTTETTNKGISYTVSVENRKIQDLTSRIEYELKKMDNADSFGMWDAAVYVISEDENTALIGANSIRSLVLGDESGKAESFLNSWGNTSEQFHNGQVEHIMEFLHYGMHPVFCKKLVQETEAADYYFTPAVPVVGNVLPSLMGLPMKSVPGVTVMEMPEFGRNIVTDDPTNSGNRMIHMGEIMYMGKKEKTPLDLSVNSLASHTLICGAPGSGKSNTVYGMLYGLSRLDSVKERDFDEAGTAYGKVTFLVIEPAKGEYKYEFSKMPGINIFTTKPDVCRMLRIDPFAFPYEEMSVMEHIERLKNIITACWALTAAMPAILSDALERAYLYAGWDLNQSVYVLPGSVKFPDFQSVLDILPRIIQETGYSSEAKGDYIGALVTRVASLTKGAAGNVFSSGGVVSDEELFDENTIIDLSTVGSTEARSLIIGVLVMKLENYRKAKAKLANYPLRHVTVLEEAHNLLPRCSTAQSDESSNIQGKSVEMISNAIAEMRTYGEGFIIVDQSPHSVADAAVSNTNTKILMRMPGSEDIETAAASVGMEESQSRQIPLLPRGQAIVKQGNWISPVVALIDRAPCIYRGRRLAWYDYDILKEVRGEVIKRGLAVFKRNANRKKIVDVDRELFLKYIDQQNDIAEYQKDIWRDEWNTFCGENHEQRDKHFPKMIVDILGFQNGLLICAPKLKQLPDSLKNPEGEFKDALKEWTSSMEEVLEAYVTCDQEERDDIIYYIMRYCQEYPPSKSHKLCATAMLLVYKEGGF